MGLETHDRSGTTRNCRKIEKSTGQRRGWRDSFNATKSRLLISSAIALAFQFTGSGAASAAERTLIQCPLYIGHTDSVGTAPRVSFDEAIRATASTTALAAPVQTDSDGIVTTELTPKSVTQPDIVLTAEEPVSNKASTETTAAPLVSPLKNAETAESPHPAETASAATSPWSRATSSEPEGALATAAPLVPQNKVPTLEDEIRAAIDATKIEEATATKPRRIVSMAPVRSEGDDEAPVVAASTTLPTKAEKPLSEDLAIVAEAELNAAPVAIPPVEAPAPVILPVWTSAPGALLTNVLEEWAADDGWTVFNQSGAIWKVTVPFTYEGTFEDAAIELISGFSHANPRPQATVYPNKTIVIRRFDNRKASNDN